MNKEKINYVSSYVLALCLCSSSIIVGASFYHGLSVSLMIIGLMVACEASYVRYGNIWGKKYE